MARVSKLCAPLDIDLTLNKIPRYKPKSLSNRLIVAIFTLIFIVQVISIAISAVFLNESHKNEMFANMEKYANNLAKSLEKKSSVDSLINALDAVDSHYRISIIDLNGAVIFDNKIPINTLNNHANRNEVQNLLQGQSHAKAVRISESEHKENLYFARFIKVDSSDDSKQYLREDSRVDSYESKKLILRISEDKESLLSYLRNFAPLFATLLIFSVLFSVLLGIYLAHKILQPIKNIDLSHPIKTNPYAELHIFMQRISRQKKKIKKQLKRIKQGRAQLELISNNINDGFLVLDSVGNITQGNAKALEILALTQGENAFSHNAEFENAIKRSITSRNEAFELTINAHFCQVICMPIFVKNAKSTQAEKPQNPAKPSLKAIVILLFDKSAQRDILALRKEFSANVTHELKTPLSSIMLSSEMLNSGLVAEADKGEFIAKIYAESKRLLGLIEKILKISFLEEVAVEKECVNLSNIIRQILPNIEILAREKGIKCEFVKCESQAQEILGIPALLEDMVYNLCENAIKYSVKNGVVKIMLGYENDGVILRIADNGIGIAKNEQERIFERFYCVDKSRSKKLGGNGLGLAIVKRIVKIHNAKIEVQSELGKGAEFAITFPAIVKNA